MGDDCGNGNLQGLIEPVNVKNEHEVGNHGGNQEDSPIGKEDDVPGDKPREYFQQSVNYPIVFDYKFTHSNLFAAGEKRCLGFDFGSPELFFD